MLVDVIMPKLGESITEGTIIQWRKNVGDTIEKDEILLEIGTDKVDSEIPSPAVGIIKEILAQPNDILPVNEVIARIETDGNGSAESAMAEEVPKVEEVPTIETPSVSSDPPVPPPPVAVNGSKRTFYTPLVYRPPGGRFRFRAYLNLWYRQGRSGNEGRYNGLSAGADCIATCPGATSSGRSHPTPCCDYG